MRRNLNHPDNYNEDSSLKNNSNKNSNQHNENEEESIIENYSDEIKKKSLQEIIEEKSDPRLKEIIYNNCAKKIINLFNSKLGHKNFNFNSNTPSKLNKITKKKKDRNFTFMSEGSSSNVIKDGFGIQKWSDGSKFLGYFKNSKSNGLGGFVDDEKNYLLGNFIDDKIEGFGIYLNNNGTNYYGEWSQDFQDGIGIEHWKDNSYYSGEFSEGKKNGIGYYKWSDGSEYKGEWENNNLKGYGIFTFSNKNKIYYGEWDNTMMNGFGELVWKKEGRKYVGYFLNDKRHGFGFFLWKNPLKIFIGFWFKGKQNGVAKYMDLKKTKFGIWKNGKIVKWFKNKEEAYQYIEPEYNNYLVYYEKSFNEIAHMLANDDNW